MAKEKDRDERLSCPVGRFFLDLEKVSGNRSKVFKHLSRSKLEFLKAMKYLIDDGIANLEKREKTRRKKKATKITVE